LVENTGFFAMKTLNQSFCSTGDHQMPLTVSNCVAAVMAMILVSLIFQGDVEASEPDQYDQLCEEILALQLHPDVDVISRENLLMQFNDLRVIFGDRSTRFEDLRMEPFIRGFECIINAVPLEFEYVDPSPSMNMVIEVQPRMRRNRVPDRPTVFEVARIPRPDFVVGVPKSEAGRTRYVHNNEHLPSRYCFNNQCFERVDGVTLYSNNSSSRVYLVSKETGEYFIHVSLFGIREWIISERESFEIAAVSTMYALFDRISDQLVSNQLEVIHVRMSTVSRRTWEWN